MQGASRAGGVGVVEAEVRGLEVAEEEAASWERVGRQGGMWE